MATALTTQGSPDDSISASDVVAARRDQAGSQVPIGRWVVWGAVGLTVAIGVTLRAWYLFHTPLNADEATVGIVARAIDAGHFSAFYPGQVYGGAEPYVVALFSAVLGHGTVAVKLTPIALSAVAAVLTWRIALRLVRERLLAALAAALVWAVPLSLVYSSTVERGFRGATLASGLGCLLLSLRILDGRRGWGEFVGFGVLAGVGWWSSPEVVYLLLPALLVLVGAMADGRAGWPGRWVPRLAATIGAAGLGALPWLWANARSGFASLHTASFAGARAPGNGGYGERLSAFFGHVLPMQLNLVQPVVGRSVLHATAGAVVRDALFVVFGAALLLCVVRGGRAIAIAGAIVAFPFVYSVQPGTWYWVDGRYAVYLVPLGALALALGVDEAVARVSRRRPRERPLIARAGRVAMAVVILGLASLSGLALRQAATAVDPRPATGLLSRWGTTEGPALRAVRLLEVSRVHHAYADYWVAYVVDYLSGGRLDVTTIPPDEDNRLAGAAPAFAGRRDWLFVPPAQDIAGWWQFGETLQVAGPDGLTESAFEGRLRALHIAYRVVDAGVLQAVVPAHSVRPGDVGLDQGAGRA